MSRPAAAAAAQELIADELARRDRTLAVEVTTRGRNSPRSPTPVWRRGCRTPAG